MFIENHKITYKNSICSPLETSKKHLQTGFAGAFFYPNLFFRACTAAAWPPPQWPPRLHRLHR